jgi:uncharacterized membrane protein (UPF0127 family)
MKSFLRALAARDGGARAIVNTRAGSVIADVVEAALDSTTRRKGLLGRDGLPERHALVLAPCNAVHTIGMRFPIDVVFVGPDGRVLKIVECLKRWRIAASWDACITVELAAGGARRADVSVGDQLVVQSPV